MRKNSFIKFFLINVCIFLGAPNGAKYTAEALDPLLTKLEELGYEIVPVSQLIYKENYHINSSGIQVADETPQTEESADDSTDGQSSS